MLEIEKNAGFISVRGCDVSLVHTFECGQCFRFNADENGVYKGIAFGRGISMWLDDGLCIGCDEKDFELLWRSFLDIDRDYGAITAALPKDDFTRAAMKHGYGLRILRQEPWEALCSFIISQCNNIPRIKGIIERLCRMFGQPVEYSGDTVYTFPDAQTLAALSAEDLAPIRAGYRAQYIISAARDVNDGRLDFLELDKLETADARRAVTRVNGVGNKVADCFLLFGMGRLDAFPVDTWMKKASGFYPGGFSAEVFGKYAGIAQQYIFYYSRANNVNSG